MAGLRRLCRMYGAMTIGGETWLWDYVKEEPRKESEMTKEEIAASEKARWTKFKEQQDSAEKEYQP